MKKSATRIAMGCLISFMFATSTLLWVSRLVNDIEYMQDLSNGTQKASNHARLMANAVSLCNVSIFYSISYSH